MFDIRELKADICGFSRSLQNSLGAYHRDLKMLPGGTSIAEHAMGPNKVFVGSRGYSIRSSELCSLFFCGIGSVLKCYCVTLITNPGGQGVKIPTNESLDASSERTQTPYAILWNRNGSKIYTRIQLSSRKFGMHVTMSDVCNRVLPSVRRRVDEWKVSMVDVCSFPFFFLSSAKRVVLTVARQCFVHEWN